MLTRKQHELLMFIDKHLRQTGFSPSFEEMKAALELRSKSGIHRLISALEERGFLQRRHHRARALEVVRLPDLAVEQAAPCTITAAMPSFTPTSLRSNPARRPVIAANDTGSIDLPLYGKIAAGLPIEALRDTSASVAVPMAMLGQGDHYALEIDGDSMIEAGILNGDLVVIRRGETAQNGEIVVALIDENEVTLKRLRKRGQSIALEPANVRHEIRIFPADRVQVQGKLVALLRKY